MPNALIVYATEHDPWFNLAFEAYLMEQLEEGRFAAVLYLWQNDNTVVIGRNQNAWVECNTGLLEAEGGRLARRSTGGGAVFHDLGNLNFSILLPRDRFDIGRNFAMLLDAVADPGIRAERSGRNDILADGLKFSAMLQPEKAGRTAPWTLLVHSAYERVARYLTVPPDKLKAKGVASVRSRITNLVSIRPEITVEGLNASMEKAFLGHFCTDSSWQVRRETDVAFRGDSRLDALHAHYASWNWRYGESLAFDAQISQRFTWGSLTLGFQISKGQVTRASVYSDALDSDYIGQIPDLLTGCRFHSADLAGALQTDDSCADDLVTPRCQMAADIAGLIREQNW